MLIDWFTVAAQVVNFLILVWLLKRFLFGPISKAIQERQDSISSSLAEAAATKLVAETEKQEYQARKAEIEAQCDGLIKEAVASGQMEKKRLLEEAQKAAETLSQSRLESLQSQEQKLEKALRERAQDEALQLAREILRQLACAELDSAIIQTFLHRLDQLDDKAQQTLQQAHGEILVRTARELNPDLRHTLEKGVEKRLGQSLRWSYKTEPELVNGLELVAGGHKIGWNSAELLEQVKRGTRRA